jgi:hypothetical protein
MKLYLLSAALVVALVVACGGSSEPKPEGPAGAGATSETTPADGATVVVDSTGDADERDDELTLREAILVVTGQLGLDALSEGESDNVDGSPGADSSDTISFDSDAFPEDDPAPISLISALPTLSTGGDIIDGEGDVAIESLAREDCVLLESEGNVIAGIQVTGCKTAVILGVAAVRNTIGSFDGRRGNVLSDNYVGIEIRGHDNAIQGNLIGTDATGTEALPNTAEGIWVGPGAIDNLIGGSTEEARNVISGNALFGISIDGSGTNGNLVIGNYIGADISGEAALGNKYGITIQAGAQGNTVGGDGEAEANLITANNTGVLIRGPDTSENIVSGNIIAIFPWEGDWVENVQALWVTDGATENTVEDNERKVLPPPEGEEAPES